MRQQPLLYRNTVDERPVSAVEVRDLELLFLFLEQAMTTRH